MVGGMATVQQNAEATRIARNRALELTRQRRSEAQARLSMYESMPFDALSDTYFRANTTIEQRTDILRLLSEKESFVGEPVYRYEDEPDIGLYPDLDDPAFIQKLLQKNEISETVSTFDPDIDGCVDANTEFEVTPVQRFVATFLHPRTPYKSMLLYHGVGVGKTCAAIQAAEAYLDMMPRGKVMIVVPKNIKQGFINTIFNAEKVFLGTGSAPNTSNQCTGDTYLRLTGSMEERNMDVIKRRVAVVVKKRYEFYGYTQFANKVRRIIESVPANPDERIMTQNIAKAIRREFNYNFLIIDEAHNLRDAGDMRSGIVTAMGQRSEEDADTQGTEDDLSDSSGGKLLTPFLRKVLDYNEGMKMLLMTATPMFNEAREIVFLMNLMIQNDKKQRTISEMDVFDMNGNITEAGKRVLGGLATKYMSFMRGENPKSFPLRFKPTLTEEKQVTPENYPLRSILPSPDPENEIISGGPDGEKEKVSKLPLVRSEVSGEFYELLRDLTTAKVQAEGVGYNTRDNLIQSGNVMFPNDLEVFGTEGFNDCFESLNGGRQYKMRRGSPNWMVGEQLRAHSPKVATMINFFNSARGICFMYSRFLKAGALFVALALEANGYTPYGREYGFLQSGVVGTAGRQCALCPLRETGHSGAHPFTPAKYVLLTGDATLSPNNKNSIDACVRESNKSGGQVKVILGSQIAAEGIDLKYIREVHVLDAWFHLNKTEQVIGRGIRFRSHCALSPEERNCTIYLHALDYPMTDPERRETIDYYSYRMALRKAIKMGAVSRTLKEYALDCNLRIGATKFINTFTDPVVQHTSQSSEDILVSLNDVGFTPICDWMENCDYQCKIQVPVIRASDDSTYGVFSAKFHESRIKKIVQIMFQQKTYFSHEEFQNTLAQASGASLPAIDYIIRSIVGNRNFRIKVNGRDGFIIYKNTYYLFQPETYADLAIPMAIRLAEYPVKRDIYTPGEIAIYPQVAQVIDEAVVRGEVATTGVNMSSFPEEYWNSFVTWISSLQSLGTNTYTETREYKDLLSKIRLFISKFENIEKELLNRLESIVIMWRRVTDKALYGKTVLEFFWDEWLPRSYQLTLLQNSRFRAEYTHVIREQLLQDTDSGLNLRFMNYETGDLEYTCNGQPCSAPVTRYYGSSAFRDPYRLDINVSNTGSPYGFLIYKSGKLVFKTKSLVPNERGELPDPRGQECANVSNTGHVKEKMKILGQTLRDSRLPDLEFTPGQIEAPSFSPNQTKMCTLLNLALRYMDAQSVSGLRWFFRPISTILTKHSGKALKPVDGSTGAPKKKKAIKPTGNTGQ